MYTAAELTAGKKPPRLNPKSPSSQDASRSAGWLGSGADEMNRGRIRRRRRLRSIDRAMAGVSRGSLLALLEAACSSPTASHRIPSLAVVFDAVANSGGVSGRPADPSLLPTLVAAAHESEPQLRALEDHQPLDVRAGAVVRWNGDLHRLLPGFLGRPIAEIDELGLLAHAIDPVLVDHRGYGLGDLIELVLRRMDHIAGVLSAAWPSDDVPEPDSPVYITDNEYVAASQLDDFFVQVDACEAPDRAREALLAHSVSPRRLACRVDDPVSVFGDTICVRFGSDEWVPVPGGLLLEALIACGVRLAGLASQLSSDAEARWRSLVGNRVGCMLAGSAHPIIGPVAASGASAVHSITLYSPTQLLVIDVAASLTRDGLHAALDSSDASLDAVVAGTALSGVAGLDRVDDDADIVRLQVAAAPGASGLDPRSKYPTATLTDLNSIARSTFASPPDLWYFLRDYAQLRDSSVIWSWNLAPLWMIWTSGGKSFHRDAVAPGLVSIDPRIMRSEWSDAAGASALERALHRLGFPQLSDWPVAWHDSQESLVGDSTESRMYRILAWEIPVAVSACDRSGLFRETDSRWALSKILSAKLKDTKDFFLALAAAAGLTHLIFELGYDDGEDGLVLEWFPDSVVRLRCNEHLRTAMLQDSHEVESAVGHLLADALCQADVAERFKQEWDAAPPAVRIDGIRIVQDALELPPPIEAHDSQLNDIQRRLGSHLVEHVDPGSYDGADAVRIESEVIYPWLIKQLHAVQARYRHDAILEFALSQLERANHHRMVNQHRIGWRRGTFDGDAHAERSEEDRLTILTKCISLIVEETVARTPQGCSSPDRLGWIELVSVAQLCIESSLRSESIHLRLADATMTITDRFGIDVSARFPEVDIHAYQDARKAAMLPNAVPMGSSEAHLPEPHDRQPQPLTDEVPDLVEVDQELKATLGFGLDALRGVLSMACEWEVSSSTYIAHVSAEVFLDTLTPLSALASRDEHARALEWLTLRKTGLLDDANDSSIEHWELERRAARVATRPFIEGANGCYVLPWTAQFTARILRNYLIEGRLPWPDRVLPDSVCRALGRYRQRVGKAFEDECARVLSDTRLIVRRGIKPSKAQRYGIDELHGEIDVLCVDPQTSRIWVIEAKDLATPFSSRSLHHHISRFTAEGGFVDKLIKKVTDVRRNAADIATHLDADSPARPWTVIGLIVTVNPEPAAYVQDGEVPICTIAQLADVVLSDHPPATGAPLTHDSVTSRHPLT